MTIIEFFRNNSTALLDNIFLLISEVGSDIVSTLFIAVILWCIDKKLGQLIAFSAFVSFAINGLIKDILKFERPVLRGILANERAAQSVMLSGGGYSYSFPSGHAQTAATVATTLFMEKKKRFLIIGAVAMTFLIGLSRVYLGVHYPIDVIIGWIIGIGISLICYKLFALFYEKRIFLYVISAVIFLFSAFFWSEDTAKSLGGLMGFAIGCMFEKRFVNYTIKDKSKITLLLRLIIGAALIVFLRAFLKNILTEDVLFFQYLRYAIIMFSGAGLYPYIFKKSDVFLSLSLSKL